MSPDLPFDALERFVAKGQRAQAEVDHLLAHGPGLTFGELAIGEAFDWAPPLQGARLPRLAMTKVTAIGYEFWIHGRVGGRRASGTAEAYYRVERA